MQLLFMFYNYGYINLIKEYHTEESVVVLSDSTAGIRLWLRCAIANYSRARIQYINMAMSVILLQYYSSYKLEINIM